MLEKLPHAIGHALKNVKAGFESVLYFEPDLAAVPERILLTSPSFLHLQPLPARYTADGAKISPPLSWQGVPSQAQSLVLLVEDADSPTTGPLTHAIVLDLPVRDGALTEGELSGPTNAGDPHLMGRNSFLQTRYLPPDPPPGHGPHRYVFQLFALNSALAELVHPSKASLHAAMKGRALAKGMIVGTYERP